MNVLRTLGRVLVPASLILLAACQSMPAKNGASTQNQAKPSQAATTSPVPATKPETTLHATSEGARVAVFLADTQSQPGWTPIKIQSGTLYVNPRPVITRADLSDIRAGASKTGVGLLALGLNDAGQSKILDVTTQNPNKRLALVVGHTMLAAPGYTTPITSQQLVFAVGTEQNATAAARAIAGMPDDAAGQSGGPAAPAKTQPAQ